MNSDVSKIRRSSVAVVGALGLAFASVACSAEGAETNLPDEIESSEVEVELDDAGGVVDGSEGGLDLDNGNVEGSSTDAELDGTEAEADINPDE